MNLLFALHKASLPPIAPLSLLVAPTFIRKNLEMTQMPLYPTLKLIHQTLQSVLHKWFFILSCLHFCISYCIYYKYVVSS
jgi:preprotein translocase subunit SecY